MFLTSCLAVGFATNVPSAKAGPFMEGIVESVFKTAEKEFVDKFARKPRSIPVESYRPATRSSAAGSPSTCVQPIERRPTFAAPRLFRNR
jgi:hypothetical protein